MQAETSVGNGYSKVLFDNKMNKFLGVVGYVTAVFAVALVVRSLYVVETPVASCTFSLSNSPYTKLNYSDADSKSLSENSMRYSPSRQT